MISIDKKSECCGCSACVSACPVAAISLREDEHGFAYPVVNAQICLCCGKCDAVCQYRTAEKARKSVQKVYAAAAKDTRFYEHSTSAGIFPFVARYVLEKGGLVFGAALEKNALGNAFVCHHICIQNSSDLHKLQGSKYVQSEIGTVYKKCKEHLEKGKYVLFSGTPCQVAGLYLYLGKDFAHLYTLDIVCHGVPNQRFFNDFITSLAPVAEIHFFRFRSKKDSGHNILYGLKKNNKEKVKSGYYYYYYYYYMFLIGKSYRESCYTCRFALNAEQRMGDLSLCDFWGLKKVHPEVVRIKEFKKTKMHNGIMVNSPKGEHLLAAIAEYVSLYDSSFENLRRYNEQLNYPVNKPADYDEVLARYKKFGYKKMEEAFRKKLGIKLYLYKIYFVLPKVVKDMIRDFQWKYFITEKTK